MRNKLILLFVAFSMVACKQEKKEESKKVVDASVKSVKTYNYNQLEPLLNKKDEKIYVVNFWATWCKPCVDELPAFEQLHTEYQDKNVEVLLVSLDFTDQVESQLLPFIKEHNLQSKVVLFDDPNQNVWIDKINKDWTGSLPATLIYNKTQRKFYEKPLNYQTLITELKQFIN